MLGPGRDQGGREDGSPSGSPVLLQKSKAHGGTVKKRKTVGGPMADGGVQEEVAATGARKGKSPL
jgi:hypothetical protein